MAPVVSPVLVEKSCFPGDGPGRSDILLPGASALFGHFHSHLPICRPAYLHPIHGG